MWNRTPPSIQPQFSPAAHEGTALCDILSNSYNSWSMKLYGDILVNGVSVTPARLQDRVSYVRQDNAFSPDMSVRQTMLFHAFLREPGTHTRARDTKGRVSRMSDWLWALFGVFPRFVRDNKKVICNRATWVTSTWVEMKSCVSSLFGFFLRHNDTIRCCSVMCQNTRWKTIINRCRSCHKSIAHYLRYNHKTRVLEAYPICHCHSNLKKWQEITTTRKLWRTLFSVKIDRITAEAIRT